MKSHVHLCIILSLFTALPCHPALAQTSQGESASQSLALEIAAAKRDGLPVSATDLQKPLPPPQRNAAPVYAQLMQLLKDTPLDEADKAPDSYGGGRNPLDATQAALIRRALADRKDVVALIHKAASCPECVFVRPWAQGPTVIFAEFARMRSVARWLSAESALLLHDGKPLDAVQNQTLGFNVARHAASDPTLIAYLVGVAIDAITLAGMERILYVAGNEAQVADAVQQAIVTNGARLDARTALRGEVAMGLLTIEFVRKDKPGSLASLSSDDDSPAFKAALASIKTRDDMNRFLDQSGVIYLHRIRKFLNAADRPYPEAISALRAFNGERQHHHDDPAFVVVNLLTPYYSPLIPARIEASYEMVRSAAAVLAWKAQHGAFPQTLAQVLKPVAVDPFNGKPLVNGKPLGYRRESKGFVVYSVSVSGHFDGGRPDVKPNRDELLFRYPMPEYLRMRH